MCWLMAGDVVHRYRGCKTAAATSVRNHLVEYRQHLSRIMSDSFSPQLLRSSETSTENDHINKHKNYLAIVYVKKVS